MELFRDTHFDFMKYRKFWIVVSIALVVVGIFSVFVHGKLNIGIDFAGGTQLTVQFEERPEVDRLRRVLTRAGIDPQIQRFGEDEANEVLIKTPTAEGTEEGSRDAVVRALDAEFNEGGGGAPLDLNRDGVAEITALLMQRDPEGMIASEADRDAAEAHYAGVAEAVLEARRETGLIASWDQVESAPGVSPAVAAVLRDSASLGSFSVIGVENVGPQMGRELRQKGILAVVLSLFGMLAYIWLRFELRFGIGALMASLHDVLVALGLFALFGYEFNLTTIAAFLTLVGYSVNDTVVIFDRMRENMNASPSEPLIDVMNRSLNETLSRTVLTSGTTLLAAGALFVLGGDVLRGFSFVLAIGVIVGTYSSIYIASPFALLWEQLVGGSARARRGGGKKRRAA
jgi:preprotein translocase subunit SecF